VWRAWPVQASPSAAQIGTLRSMLAEAKRPMVLLGGGKLGERSEAEVARDGLHARGFPRDFPLAPESQSRT